MEHSIYLKNHQAVITTSIPDAGAKPVGATYDVTDKGVDVQPWGANNLLPKENRIKLEKSTTALPLITRMVEAVFGAGVFYYEQKRVGGKLEITYPEVPAIDEFLANNRINYQSLERIMDLKVHGNIFGQLIANKVGTAIVGFKHLEAEFSRFGNVNESNKVEQLLYKGDWEGSADPIEIPYLDADDLNNDEIVLKVLKSKKEVAMHSCFPSPGHSLYAVPPHNAIFEKDGWLDYVISVPKIMNAINKNAQNIKYHVRIPSNYWESAVKGWTQMSREEQKKEIDSKIEEMESWFTGAENAGKTFYTHFAVDPITNKPINGWEIIQLDDKDKKDKFLTSVQEGDSQIARAIGLDTSMAGIQASGGKLGAGSGSDKEEGFNNTRMMSHAATLVVFDFLYLIGKINKWPPTIKWGFLDPKSLIFNALTNDNNN